MQIGAIPDSTAGAMDQTNQPVSAPATAACGPQHSPCISSRRWARASRCWRCWRPCASTGPAMFGWLGVALVIDAHRRPDRAPARRRAAAAELVGRGARSRGRFRHLRVRAGLCDHRERPAAAAGRAAARRRHRGVGRALFRRSPHEERRTIIFAAFRRCGMRRRSICSCCICRRRCRASRSPS